MLLLSGHVCAHLRRFFLFFDIYATHVCMFVYIKFWIVPVLVIDVRNCCKRYANVQINETKQFLMHMCVYTHIYWDEEKKQPIKIFV